MSRIKEKPQSGEYGNKRNDKGGTNRTAEVCAKTKVPGTYIRDPLGHAGKRKTAALQKHAELKELLKPYTIENLTCRKRKKKKAKSSQKCSQNSCQLSSPCHASTLSCLLSSANTEATDQNSLTAWPLAWALLGRKELSTFPVRSIPPRCSLGSLISESCRTVVARKCLLFIRASFKIDKFEAVPGPKCWKAAMGPPAGEH